MGPGVAASRQRPWQGQRESKAATAALAHDPNCYLCTATCAPAARAILTIRTHSCSTTIFRPCRPTRRPCGKRTGCWSPKANPGAAASCAFLRVTISPCRAWRSPTSSASSSLGRGDDRARRPARHRLGADLRESGRDDGRLKPHPHGQIWATRHLPNELEKETHRQSEYLLQHGRPLLLDYLAQELQHGERVVLGNDDFCVLVPFWAIWPFETMILPRRRIGGFDEMSAGEKTSLAQVLSQLTKRYDSLFDVPFPYSMGFHQKPTDGAAARRMADARAFLSAAAALRDHAEIHGRLRNAGLSPAGSHPGGRSGQVEGGDRVINAVVRAGMSRRGLRPDSGSAKGFGHRVGAAVRADRFAVRRQGVRQDACVRGSSLIESSSKPVSRETRRHPSGAVRPVAGRARRQGRHFVDEPVPSPHRLDAQKKTLIAREQDRPDVKRHRIRWRKYQKLVDPSRLVFIDETWTKTNMTRLYGWAPRGRRLVDKVPHGHWKTSTFLAALRCDRVEAPCLFDGPINGERFLAYVSSS